MATMYGNNGVYGYLCNTETELRKALKGAWKNVNGPTIINMRISPTATRKAQDFDWLTKSKL